jgi:spoIIIJ-associated protein
MKKIEAPTLADAYEKAALELDCSITELHYEVIQHPSNGVFGLFKKSAIIVADCKRKVVEEPEVLSVMSIEVEEQEPVSSEEPSAEEVSSDSLEQVESQEAENVSPEAPQRVKHQVDEALTQGDETVLESFFEGSKEKVLVEKRPANNNLELAEKIEEEIKKLISYSCFDIDRVEVDVVDNTALIFIDGNDAALLIGKEGYRYNALSYMLFNWLHGKYDLYVKLEIAQFLTTQQEMIQNYIKPVIEYVELNGRGKTRPLDGILVQIALEQLREVFPNKYVAVKTGRDGRKFIVINDFNSRRNV